MTMKWPAGAVVALGLLAAFGASGSVAQSGGGAPTPNADGRYLPDLIQIMPARVGVATRRSARGTRTLLTFATAVHNNGAGPLIIRASRPDQGTSRMSGRQVVARSDGRREFLGGVLPLRYVRGGGHSHWHLEDFERYELRTVSGQPLRRDRKTGFCLGDRYDASGDSRLPGEPRRAIYRAQCGRNDPGRLSLTQGISVGFGDRYPARVEGQYVDITGLPTGRYTLVLRVDPNGLLADLHDDNDTASLLVKIVRGSPTRARILAWCNSGPTCTTPTVR